MLTPEEVNKVNNLYNQIDTLQARVHNVECFEHVEKKLEAIESKLDQLIEACACPSSKSAAVMAKASTKRKTK